MQYYLPPTHLINCYAQNACYFHQLLSINVNVSSTYNILANVATFNADIAS